MGDEKQITRKGSPPIKVYCLPEERELIEANDGGVKPEQDFARHAGKVRQAFRELAAMLADAGRR